MKSRALKSRALIVATAVAALCFAATGHAAPAPQIVDPKGDNVAVPGTDIHSVTFAATRKAGKVSGFKLTMALDAPPVQRPGFLYRVFGNHDTCGTFQVSSAGTAAVIVQNQVFMSCGSPPDATGSDATIINVSPIVKGNSLEWTFRLKDFPKEFQSGTLSGLEAFVTPADPVFGIFNTADFVPGAAYDVAAGKGTFTY